MRELALRARAAHPAELVSYTWVPREKNRAADRLVNAALDGTWDPGAALTDDLSEDLPGSADVPSGLLPGTLPGWSPQVGLTTTTVLLRHGHTHHSAAKRFSGAGGDDPALNDLGVAEAQAAASSLANRGGIEVIVSSPMRRTRQTADVVASAMRCSVVEEPDVRECDFGEWEGYTFAEVKERWPDELAAWLHSTSVAPPGGESFDAVLARVDDGLARLRRDYAGQTALVVSHVTPIKALVRAALGVDASVLFRMELLPASISTVRWYEDGAASLTGFNDVSHLRDGRAPAEQT
jgi:broad specificity phosphatase PhoE